MASKALKKINAKLKFLYYQSRYLTPAYKRLLCNALIQPHFDYRCSSWFLLLKKNLKLKLQKAQNKYIRFCLNLPARSHIDPSHFRKITGFRLVIEQNTVLQIPFLKYWNGIVQGYILEVFEPSLCKYSTRVQMTLDISLWKTNTGQKSLHFLGPKI